ncbi:MAG: hypothetical protein AAFX58_08495 [Pseudomonadota bacterium]
MTHLLFKPHVVNGSGAITTPDILLDKVFVNGPDGATPLPVHRVQCATALQVDSPAVLLTPAFALAAAGGGALLGIALLIRNRDEPAGRPDALLCRQAWRLRHDGRSAGDVELRLSVEHHSETIRLGDSVQARSFLRQADAGWELARGVLCLCTPSIEPVVTDAPASVRLTLANPDRDLRFVSELVPVTADRWDERPWPRYSTGPAGDVEHYI